MLLSVGVCVEFQQVLYIQLGVELFEQHVPFIKKSQILSYSQIEINNFYNFQYYCRIDVGSPPQRFDVILDTGSHHLYLPAKNCTNCPYTVRKYNPNISTTATVSSYRDSIVYGKGEVSGYYVTDLLVFQNNTVPYRFLAADYQKDTENSQADGLMGLSNYKKVDNIFDILYGHGELISSKIGFSLGLRELKQKSYFYYNITNDDFPEAVFINTSRSDYWTIPIRQLKAQSHSFYPKHALIDSGTSLIIMPQKLYNEFDQFIFSKYCEPYSNVDLRRCKCPVETTYPNITVYSSTISFNITPEAYILGSYKNRVCRLGIDKLRGNLDFVILGDLFFHHQTIIFDKSNSQIGFVNNHRNVNIYPNSSAFSYFVNIFTLTALLAAVCILGLRSQFQNNSSSIRQPLRVGGTLEMVQN